MKRMALLQSKDFYAFSTVFLYSGAVSYTCQELLLYVGEGKFERAFILKGFKGLADDSQFVLDIKHICPYTFQIERNFS